MKQIGGYEDITPGRPATGLDALRMRVWHIVETPVGRLPQDPTWGWGLRRRLGTKTTAGDLKTEAAIGREALRKDPEVRDATVTIARLTDNRYRVLISVTPLEGGTLEIDREVTT
jgi:phage baseplate assembly protein W